MIPSFFEELVKKMGEFDRAGWAEIKEFGLHERVSKLKP